MIEIKWFAPGDTTLLKEHLALRYDVMRKPKGMPPGSEVDDEENSFYHLVALDKNKIVGGATIREVEPKIARIRYMGVENSYRKQGIGKQLCKICVDIARSLNLDKIYILARVEALDFWKKSGFLIVGDEFIIEGIGPHYRMELIL